MKRILLAGLLTAAAGLAQNISVGVIGGAPFTTVESSTTINGISYLPKSPYFTVGGVFQLNVPFHLRLEFDTMFRPAAFRVSTLPSNTTLNEWRFPLILQYRLGEGKAGLQPFVGMGASFEHLYQISNAVTSGPGSIATNSPAGLLIDGGLDFKLKLFRLSGELRYTRQFNSSILDVSQLNQAEVLFGAHF